MGLIELDNGRLRLGSGPDIGAGISSLSLSLPEGASLPLMRPAPEGTKWFNDLACYLLAPWSNRIKAAAFEWQRAIYQLPADWKDGTAIHGLVKDKPWRVEQRSPVSALLSHEGGGIAGWPWRFRCEVSYALEGRAFAALLKLTHISGPGAMPAGVGFHPFWSRRLRGETDDARARIAGLKRYPCEGMLPVGAAMEDEVAAHLAAGKPLGKLSLDDVFHGTTSGADITWLRSGVRVRYTCSPELGHTVVFTGAPDERGDMPASFCIEPVSMVNDGFNLAGRGWAETGVRSLSVGETMSVWWRVQVDTI